MSCFILLRDSDNDCIVDLLQILFITEHTDSKTEEHYVQIRFKDPSSSCITMHNTSAKEVFKQIKKITSSAIFKETFPDIDNRFLLMDINNEIN